MSLWVKILVMTGLTAMVVYFVWWYARPILKDYLDFLERED